VRESNTDTGTRTVSGGFVLEISPDELTAYSAGSARSLHTNPMTRFVTYILVALYFLTAGLYEFVHFDGLLCLILILLPLYVLIKYFFIGDQNLHCSPEVLDVVWVRGGRIKQIESLSRTEIRQIQYGAVSYSKQRPTKALLFSAGNRHKKILCGLKCLEAQEILDQLQRWGYDVVRDTALSTTVEEEQWKS